MAPKNTQGGSKVELIPGGAAAPSGGFESRGLSTLVKGSDVGALSAIAREEGEIKAAVALAKLNPRDELGSYNKLMASCGRVAFAQSAMYHFPRGGQTIEGPSVDLARETARVWGNIRYGLRIVAEDDDSIHIQGAAMDLETNNAVQMEDKFKKLIYRKDGGWIKPDERDLRELVNRRGAILVRNALLQILPPDVVDSAVLAAKKTIKAAASGELGQDRQQAVRSLVVAFSEFQVTKEMLSAKLGHDLELVDDEEMATLRGIWKSLSDGHTRREEHFQIPQKKSGAETGSIDPAKITGKKPDDEPKAT